MTRFSTQYQATLRSARWRGVRQQALQRANFRCESCGGRRRLDGHHWRGYKMLGREQPADIRMLCRTCHRRAHGQGRGRRITWRMVVAVGLLLGTFWVLHPHG